MVTSMASKRSASIPRSTVAGTDFSIVGDEVFYDAPDGRTRKLRGADAATFRVPLADYQDFLAVDRRHVYVGHQVLEGADPATFAFLPKCLGPRALKTIKGGGYYATDARRAYFIATYGENVKARVKVLPTKDPTTLTYFVDPLRDHYGFARDTVYEYNAGQRTPLKRRAEEAARTYEFTGVKGIVTDGTHRYRAEHAFEQKPAFGRAKIGGRYYDITRLRSEEKAELVQLSKDWSTDGKTVFLRGRPQKSLDAASFVLLSTVSAWFFFVKDARTVRYYKPYPRDVKDLDPKTTVAVHRFWARDKRGHYSFLQRRRFKEIDEATFVIHPNGSAEDAKHHYKLMHGSAHRAVKKG
jgi:hypothetical protein